MNSLRRVQRNDRLGSARASRPGFGAFAETNFRLLATGPNWHDSAIVNTRELIDKEVASLPEELQRKVYEFAMRLKKHPRDESFNGAELSDSVLARDWNSPEEDAAWSNL